MMISFCHYCDLTFITSLLHNPNLHEVVTGCFPRVHDRLTEVKLYDVLDCIVIETVCRFGFREAISYIVITFLKSNSHHLNF